jgi:hypothetical protein
MPIYGAIIARGWSKGKFEKYALWIIGIHFVLGSIGFLIKAR